MGMSFAAGGVLEQVDLNNMLMATNGDGVYAHPDSTSLEVIDSTTSGMWVDVKAGSCYISDTKYTESSTVSLVLTVSHATYYRKDLITYNPSTVNPVVTMGSYHAGGDSDPIYPPAIPSGHILLAIVDVDPGVTEIYTADIHDKRIMITDSVYDIAPGGALLDSDTSEVNIATTSYVLKKTIALPTDLRAFNIELSFEWTMKGVATGTVYGQIYRGTSPVGTEKSITGSVHTATSDIVSGWSGGDSIRLYCKRGTSTDGWVANFKIYGAYIKPW